MVAGLKPMNGAVAIVGGGYAGMACAVELARRGVEVTVFERSRTLGGRARVLRKNGRSFDNGQHLLLGAYTELARLLRLTGVTPRLLEQLPLTLHVPGQLRLRAAPLPAPWHLAVGAMLAQGLSWRERWALRTLIAHVERTFRFPEEMSVTDLLAAAGQPPRLCALVWEPLCLAALNTPAPEASARVFANVLRDALTVSAAASEMLIPRVDLSELFPVPAARYLATHGGEVRTGNAIAAIVPDGEAFRLDGDPHGRTWAHVVVATAPRQAAPLVASTNVCTELAVRIAALPCEPIATVYLAFGAGVELPTPLIGLTDGPIQWAFDRGLCGGPPGLIAAVASACHEQARDRAGLVVAAREQIARVLDYALPAPEWTQVVIEKQATVACRPGQLWPRHTTPLPGLWLAGDYVGGEYPATLESAVRAGVRCAQGILADAD